MMLYRLLLALSFVLFVPAVSQAQFRASVQGNVLDPSGAVVPNATVTLINSETGRQQQSHSNDDGFYVFNGLAPGLYTATAEKAGFRKLTLEAIRVEAEQVRGLNLQLETGEISQSITVTASGPAASDGERKYFRGILIRGDSSPAAA